MGEEDERAREQELRHRTKKSLDGSGVSSSGKKEPFSRPFALSTKLLTIADSSFRSLECKSGKRCDKKGRQEGEMRCELRQKKLIVERKKRDDNDSSKKNEQPWSAIFLSLSQRRKKNDCKSGSRSKRLQERQSLKTIARAAVAQNECFRARCCCLPRFVSARSCSLNESPTLSGVCRASGR